MPVAEEPSFTLVGPYIILAHSAPHLDGRGCGF